MVPSHIRTVLAGVLIAGAAFSAGCGRDAAPEAAGPPPPVTVDKGAVARVAIM